MIIYAPEHKLLDYSCYYEFSMPWDTEKSSLLHTKARVHLFSKTMELDLYQNSVLLDQP